MIDCNGYSLPSKLPNRSNYMAAYPAENPLNQMSHPSYRDYQVYGTYPRKTWNSQRDGDIQISADEAIRSNGTNCVDHLRTVKGILRNKNEYTPVSSVNHAIDESVDTVDDDYRSDSPIGRRKSALTFCVTVFGSYIRPLIAEFLSVLFAVFVVTLVEASLQEQRVSRVYTITVIATFEGICLFVCASTFQGISKVHINPAITLGSLFAGGTKPVLCFLYWIVQIIGATTGVFLYQVVTINGPPVLPSLLHSQSDLWLTSMYRLVLCQTISSAMLVMSYLNGLCPFIAEGSSVDSCHESKLSQILGVSGAVTLTAFVSLLSSTGSWNPGRSTGTCLAAMLQSPSLSVWQNHYIFWLGPMIGSLFASFFYRLIFASEEFRISSCQRRN